MDTKSYKVRCPICGIAVIPPRSIVREMAIIGLGEGDFSILCSECKEKEIVNTLKGVN